MSNVRFQYVKPSTLVKLPHRCSRLKSPADLKKCHKTSINRLHHRAQLTGRGVVGLSQLPGHIITELDKSCHGIAGLLHCLDRCAAAHLENGCAQVCVTQLKALLGNLINFETTRTHTAGTDTDSVVEWIDDYSKQFYHYGGITILTRLLLVNSTLPPGTHHSTETESNLLVKSLVLEILTRLIITKIGAQVCDVLIESEDILNYIFTLLSHKKTFINACQLIEDILQSNPGVLDLHRIGNLRDLVNGLLEDRHLGNFCRILAVTISDLDIYDNKSSLFAQNKQKRSTGFVNVRDINQELLLGIPELLQQLVKFAIDKDYIPRYRGMVSELDCWMEWIENQMMETSGEPAGVEDFDNFIGGISEPMAAGGVMNQQQGLAITEDLVHRVEVIYVLGLFLVGKHRKKVQRKLAELKLAPGLSDLFDQFIWKCQSGVYITLDLLQPLVSNEVALKIQFLRLVHSFCDHSDFKHLLLSKSELNELKKINSKAPEQVLTFDSINKQLMCKGNKGLLTKIVDVMKKEPTTSTFRFWLARAVESYLRGSTSYCDQVFLMRRGLLSLPVPVSSKFSITFKEEAYNINVQVFVSSCYLRGSTSYCDQVFLMRRGLLSHVASNIVENDIRHKEILQSSFDLLGELIKFNVEAFKAFDDVLNTKEKFDKFVGTINKNLVDSNMFIRGLVLSVEHFHKNNLLEDGYGVPESKLMSYISDFKPQLRYGVPESKLMSYISDFKTQLRYLYKLIKIINVQNLTQENVSCLNTTLVFLMFANEKSGLPKYLQALRDERDESRGSDCIMSNFRELLMFWQDHYLHKDKDCSALEKSSRISFDYWKETVSTLVCEDRSCTRAIMSYVPLCAPSYADRTN